MNIEKRSNTKLLLPCVCVCVRAKRFTTVFTPYSQIDTQQSAADSFSEFYANIAVFSLWCNDTCLYVVPAGAESQHLTFKQQGKGQGKGHH